MLRVRLHGVHFGHTKIIPTGLRPDRFNYKARGMADLQRSSPNHRIEADIPVCLFRFPEEAVVSVIVGCRVSEDTRKAIHSTLADKSYSHVRHL